MPRVNPSRFVEGDIVLHADGRVGEIVLSYPRKRDGARYPIVRVIKGKGSREWPSRGWRVILDRGSGTRCICVECERRFEADTHVSLCAQCQRRQGDEEGIRTRLERHARTTNEERDALQRPWRLHERVGATSANVTPETEHPRDCLCDRCLRQHLGVSR